MKKMISLLLFLTAVPAFAGILATGNGFVDMEGGETFVHKLACQGDMARWDFSGKKLIEGSVLYRGDRDVFWVIDPIRKSYFELPAVSPGDKAMRIGVLAILYGVACRALSKDQQAELDRALSRMPLPEALLDFKPKGTARWGRFPCDRFEAAFNGEKCGEYLTSEAKGMGLADADYASLAGFLKTLNLLYDNFDFLFPDPAAGERKPYSGIPVKWAFFKAGRTTFSMEFKSVERREIDPARFELPAGLKKVEVFDLLTNRP